MVKRILQLLASSTECKQFMTVFKAFSLIIPNPNPKILLKTLNPKRDPCSLRVSVLLRSGLKAPSLPSQGRLDSDQQYH